MALDTELQAALLGSEDRLIPSTGTGGAEEALVKAAQNGDRSAFGELYARYARMVHGILLSRVPPAHVDDLVQDVFVQALPRLGTLRDPLRFAGWLAAIARNRATDFHRRSKPDVELQEDAHAGAKQEPAPDHAERTRARIVLQAIQALPDAYRETLMLRLVEGMTGPEIAARTGLSHGSVRVNLHRGMLQLREALARQPGVAQQGMHAMKRD